MTVKRIDRTVQMMRELDAGAAKALEQAALKLKTIAQAIVSKKYVKKPRKKLSADKRARRKGFKDAADEKAFMEASKRTGTVRRERRKAQRDAKARSKGFKDADDMRRFNKTR